MTGLGPRDIRISDYFYELPEDKIAKHPLQKRDDSKLLVYQNQTIKQTFFSSLPEYLDQDHLLVFNTTKVIRARLNFKSAQEKSIEIFCLEPGNLAEIGTAMASQVMVEWNCLVGNLKQWKEKTLCLNAENVSLKAEIIEKFQTHVKVLFSWEPRKKSFAEVLEILGSVPIPPYLNRKSEPDDQKDYQTVFAKEEGSVAAPTAGLHFTESLLESLQSCGIRSLSLILHVGAGTFKPVKSEQMSGHEMHAEWLEVDRSFLEALILANNKQIIPVGTTSLRTLESLYWMGYKLIEQPKLDLAALEISQWEVYTMEKKMYSKVDCLQALINWMDQHQLKNLVCKTQILIAPPYQLKMADGIITNFHQPASTLLLLVSAIVGTSWREIYEFALNNNFRFLSYGDASLLLK